MRRQLPAICVRLLYRYTEYPREGGCKGGHEKVQPHELDEPLAGAERGETHSTLHSNVSPASDLKGRGSSSPNWDT